MSDAAWRLALAALAVEARAGGEDDVERRLLAGLLRRVAPAAIDDLGLALLAGLDPDDPLGAAGPEPPAGTGPDVLGPAREALLADDERRRTGAHYTDPELAGRLVAWATDGWDPGPGPIRVVDLAVGGGAFLFAAARGQVVRGADPATVVAHLGGVDVDPLAVAVAEAALLAWALAAGADPSSLRAHRPRLAVGDGLLVDRVGGLRAGAVDLVVGNPPFLGQLARATARDRATAEVLRARYGEAAGGYADAAALFLVAACRWVRPGGRAVLVLPESVLGARDGAGARAAVAADADLVGLWVARAPAFAAGVDVCAPVVERRSGGAPAAAPPVRRAHGLDVVPDAAAPPVGRPPSWSALLAGARGVPVVALAGDAGAVGDLATATAGFRQHFYALAPHLREAEVTDGGEVGVVAPLATTGMVDPVALRWGRRAAKVAGRTWQRPVVDLAGLDTADPAVAAWVRARLRPKVLVAPQTRMVEAAPDPDGRFVPGVPLVAVEPLARDDVDGLWLLVAALSAPPVTAWALQESAGTARHGDALKLAARQVRSVPLPVDPARWAAATAALRAGTALAAVGPELTAAYGLDPDHPVTAWWAARLTVRRAGEG